MIKYCPPRVKYLDIGSNLGDLTLGIKKSLLFDPPKILVPPIRIVFLVFGALLVKIINNDSSVATCDKDRRRGRLDNQTFYHSESSNA